MFFLVLILSKSEIGVANPIGGVVTAGNATIASSGNATQINQSSDKAIINWNSFNIAANETTQFNQPSAQAVALNRIDATQGASNILGKLSANGQVWLVNPAGIMFGAGAQVDVAGLVATSANITDADFLSGNYHFTGGQGTVTNAGTIHISDGGFAALVAPTVINSGVIRAHLGKVALAAGSDFTLDFYGDNLINFDAGSVGNSVTNSGKIIANGGTVLLTVQTAQNVVNNVINMSGVIQANSVGQEDGEIVLSGGPSGIVNVTGKLIASGHHHGQTGGTIKVLGDEVGLFGNAQVIATGSAGGGVIDIGGDFHGAGPDQNASYTYIAPNVTVNASAVLNGNGGKVAVWSNLGTQFYGTILAKGGAQSGNGGFVETSGEAYLNAQGNVYANAPQGTAGSWLLDPQANVEITAATTFDGNFSGGNPDTFTTSADSAEASAATINADLAGGTSVTILTTPGGTGLQAGNITVDSLISSSGTGSVTLSLQAAGSILLNAPITLNAASTTVNLTAGNGSITQGSSGTAITAATLSTSSTAGTTLNDTGNAVQNLNATDNSSTGISFTNTATTLNITGITESGSGGITLNNTGNLSVTGTVSSVGGTIALTSSDVVNVSGKISASGNTGGTIKILGNEVGLFGNAQILATGDFGGGVIDIGGDFHGAGPDQNASYTYIAPNVTIDASALLNGNGGKVAVWSNLGTQFYGTILARGGAQGGNGGFVETSGEAYLNAQGNVYANAPHGTAGSWLLDPQANVDITASTTFDGSFSGGNPDTFTTTGDSAIANVATINADLAGGTSVTILTTPGGTGLQAGNITVDSLISSSATGITLTLQAVGSITLNAPITFTSGNSTVDLTAGGTITESGGGAITTVTLNTSSVGGTILNAANAVASFFSATNTGSGDIQLTNTTAASLQPSTISNSGGGNIVITNTGQMEPVGGSISTTGNGSITLTANGSSGFLEPAEPVTAGGSGAVTLSTSGGLIIDANVSSTSGSITLFGGNTGLGNGIGVSGNITTTGNITITETGSDISQGGSNVISGNLLTTSSAGGSSLIGANTVHSFNATDNSRFGIQLTNTAATLTITGITESVSGGITLNNTGAIVQSGAISGGLLTTTSTTGTTLTGTNTVTSFNATDSSSTGINLTNSGTLSITGISESGSGNVTVTASGAMNTNGTITTHGGNVVLTTTGAGVLTIGSGINTNGGSITATAANTSGLAIALVDNGNLNTSPGSGGVLTIGSGVFGNATLTLGAGNITLIGNGPPVGTSGESPLLQLLQQNPGIVFSDSTMMEATPQVFILSEATDPRKDTSGGTCSVQQ